MKEQVFNTDHLEKVRRKRRRRKVRIAVVLGVLLAGALVWLTGIGSLYLTRIGSVLETWELRLHPGNGCPVALTMGTQTRSHALTGALVLMDDRDVYVYSDTGSALRNFQHGYARPGLAAGKTRFCIYNQGGRELRIEGRSQSYGTLNTAKAIQFAAMSAGGNFAVVTQSDTYQAQMTVYSDSMDELFSWYCANEYPTIAAFSPSGREVAVGCVTSGGGTLQSVLYLVNADGERASLRRTDSLILQLTYRSSGQLAVAYDDAVVLYDARTLEVQAEYALPGSLLCCDLGGANILLVQGNDSMGAGVELTVLSDALQPVRTVSVGDMVRQCALQDGRAWLIGKNQIFCYTVEETAGADTSFQPEHRPICLIPGERKLLLLTARQIVEIMPPTEQQSE